MSTVHTPGPWAAFTDGSGTKPHTNIVAYVPCTAVVFSLPGHDKTDADVRLIAAAPDLLAACEAQQRAIDRLMAKLIDLDDEFMPTQSEVWPAVEQAHDAIAKATGSAS